MLLLFTFYYCIITKIYLLECAHSSHEAISELNYGTAAAVSGHDATAQVTLANICQNTK